MNGKNKQEIMENDANLEKTNNAGGLAIWLILLFVLSGVCMVTASVLYDLDRLIVQRNLIVVLLGTGGLIFLLLDALRNHALPYGNEQHLRRFVLLDAVFVILSVLLPLIPYTVWPYLAIFVMLGLCSDVFIGLYAGSLLVMSSVLLGKESGNGEFFLYVLAGAVALALFRNLKENSAISGRLFVAVLMLVVLLTTFDVLFQNRRLAPGLFFLPGLNVIVSLILLLTFLNYFSTFVIRRTSEIYMEINDTEFELLVRMRDRSKDEYYRAIHTAYLAERAARALNLDDRAVKTCSYYHRYGAAMGQNHWEQVGPEFEAHHFPLEAQKLLQEYMEPAGGKIRSRETWVVSLCDTVVSSIMYIFREDPKAQVQYDELIDKIFARKQETGELAFCELSYADVSLMTRMLKKEKLYYDFLR